MQHCGRVTVFGQSFTFYWGESLLSVYETQEGQRGRPRKGILRPKGLKLRADATRLVVRSDAERRRVVKSLLIAQRAQREYVATEGEVVELEALRKREAELRQKVRLLSDFELLVYVRANYGESDG